MLTTLKTLFSAVISVKVKQHRLLHLERGRWPGTRLLGAGALAEPTALMVQVKVIQTCDLNMGADWLPPRTPVLFSIPYLLRYLSTKRPRVSRLLFTSVGLLLFPDLLCHVSRQ